MRARHHRPDVDFMPMAKIQVRNSGQILKAAIFDGYEYGFLFDYFNGINDVLKRHGGRYVGAREHAYYRYWRFQKREVQDNAEAIYRELRDRSGAENCVQTYRQFASIIDAASASPVKSAFVHGLKGVVYQVADGSVALVCTYHSGVVSIARNMSGRYLPAMKAWKFTGTTAHTVKNNIVLELDVGEDQVEVFDGVVDIVDDQFSPVKFNEVGITIGGDFPESSQGKEEEEGDGEVYLSMTAPLARSPLTAEEIEAALARYSLYEFQKDGVRHLAGNTSALLADDMGLGKTRQATVAADIVTRSTGKILVACPASLIVNWTREIRMIAPDNAIAVQSYDPAARWIVTNYERLESMVGCASEFEVMIIDEAHFLKEPHVQRTRIAFDVASQIPFRFLLTGTPILNREAEMHTLLRLSGHPIGQIPLKEYEKQFAGSPSFRAELNARIQEWMLRRMKDMVLTHLQGKQHQVLPVVIERDREAEYQEILNDSSLYPLQKVIRLRQWLEQVKLPVVIEMIQEMQADDKVLIFCEFKDTVAQYARLFAQLGIRAVTLTGEDSATKRQKTVDAFQNDPEIRIFVGTTMAAGVGLNLTAANYVVFTSLPWTPALKEQAEDRAYRNGQMRLVIVKIPLVDNTIDGLLWQMLAHKKTIANEVLDPSVMQAELADSLMKKAA